MGVKGLLGGGMVSDSKSVKQVTDPIRKVGGITESNFEQELRDKRKSVASKGVERFGVGSSLIK